MNKKNIFKILILNIFAIIFIIYFVNLIVKVSKRSKIINETELKVAKLKRNILEERKNKKIIEKMSEDFLTNAYFDKEAIVNYVNKHEASSILCTSKDKVKLDGIDIPLSEMKLKLMINCDILTNIESYIKGYKRER